MYNSKRKISLQHIAHKIYNILSYLENSKISISLQHIAHKLGKFRTTTNAYYVMICVTGKVCAPPVVKIQTSLTV